MLNSLPWLSVMLQAFTEQVVVYLEASPMSNPSPAPYNVTHLDGATSIHKLGISTRANGGSTA
jgi:hypothetical protein